MISTPPPCDIERSLNFCPNFLGNFWQFWGVKIWPGPRQIFWQFFQKFFWQFCGVEIWPGPRQIFSGIPKFWGGDRQTYWFPPSPCQCWAVNQLSEGTMFAGGMRSKMNYLLGDNIFPRPSYHVPG